MYGLDEHRIKSLTDFNTRIQEEGREVKRILDLALSEQRENEKVSWGCWVYKLCPNLRICGNEDTLSVRM